MLIKEVEAKNNTEQFLKLLTCDSDLKRHLCSKFQGIVLMPLITGSQKVEHYSFWVK